MFQVFVTDIMFHFFQIILLMFGKNLLYVIAKGMCVLIGVSFLLTFTFLLQVAMLYRFVLFLLLECMKYWLLTISDVLNLYEGSCIDRFVFYIFWCKVCCFWYTCRYLEKKYWFLKFCTQIYLGRILCLIRLIFK